jgi:PAS domain S-box-containing protein
MEATGRDVLDDRLRHDSELMEARFRDLLESTPDAIVMAGASGHIVITNSQAERLFGYLSGELKGMSVDLLLPERYRHAHVGHRSQYFLQPRKRAMGSGLDLSGLRKDGTEFPIEISLSPLQSEDSTFVMSAIRDISERKQFEHALRETNEELANAIRAKDHFLAGMSHELRTPLNAIIGFTGTLLMRLPGPLNQEQEKQLHTVQRSSRHLLALINDLLDIARIEAGKMPMHVELLDARVVVNEVVGTLRPQAEAKGLALSVEGSDSMDLHTDLRALSQIVINLVNNAVKFTSLGSIRIVLQRETRADRQVMAIHVIDSGIGIAREEQARLFEPFSRVEATAGAAEGTGLGLHLSQKLARTLGGSIELQSQPGAGSTFTLRLPVA